MSKQSFQPDLPEETARRALIREACESFIENLTRKASDGFPAGEENLVHHPLVFVILDEVARDKGLQLSAEQRGVQGTVLTFTVAPKNDTPGA